MPTFSANFQQIHFQGFAAYRSYSCDFLDLAAQLHPSIDYISLPASHPFIEQITVAAQKQLGYSLLPHELMPAIVSKSIGNHEIVDDILGALSKLTGMSEAIYELRVQLGSLEYVIRDYQLFNTNLRDFILEIDANLRNWEQRQHRLAA